jgi:transposase
MRKIREVLRLKHEQGRSRAEIAASAGIGETTVSDYLARARGAGVTWTQASAMTDAEVESRLFHRVGQSEPPERVPIDFAWVHRELSRVGVTLQTLWVEYREGAATAAPLKPYEYSRFCDLYARWREKLAVSMRQVHRAGEKLFIDYSGKKLRIVDRTTGEVTEVEVFVAVLGASNYTYAEATRTQKLADFVGSTVRAFEFLGCVPEIMVPDQLRSAVSGPDRYEPDINPTYLEMAQHYGVTVIPARPRKPKDKAKVEGGVLIVQRWIVAALRNRTFYSLAELNAAIRELVEKLNARPFKKLDGCRRSAFETIDRPAMRPLPVRRYELAEWKHAKVNIDYCVTVDYRHYSVPYALVGEAVEIRATARCSTEACASRAMLATTDRRAPPPSLMSTARAPIASTASGRPSVSSPGPRASAVMSASSRAPSWLAVRIPRPATARASASSVWPTNTVASASMPHARGPSRSAARASRPCSRS